MQQGYIIKFTNIAIEQKIQTKIKAIPHATKQQEGNKSIRMETNPKDAHDQLGNNICRHTLMVRSGGRGQAR